MALGAEIIEDIPTASVVKLTKVVLILYIWLSFFCSLNYVRTSGVRVRTDSDYGFNNSSSNI